MQGLSDGYFVLPYTVGNYLATSKFAKVDESHPRSAEAPWRRSSRPIEKLLAIKGKRTVDSFHRELGKIMWDYCGMSRTAAGPRNRDRHRFASCARNSGRTSTCRAAATS